MKKNIKYMTLAFTPGSGQKLKDIKEMVIISWKGLKESADVSLKDSEEKAPIIC